MANESRGRRGRRDAGAGSATGGDASTARAGKQRPEGEGRKRDARCFVRKETGKQSESVPAAIGGEGEVGGGRGVRKTDAAPETTWKGSQRDGTERARRGVAANPRRRRGGITLGLRPEKFPAAAKPTPRGVRRPPRSAPSDARLALHRTALADASEWRRAGARGRSDEKKGPAPALSLRKNGEMRKPAVSTGSTRGKDAERVGARAVGASSRRSSHGGEGRFSAARIRAAREDRASKARVPRPA